VTEALARAGVTSPAKRGRGRPPTHGRYARKLNPEPDKPATLPAPPLETERITRRDFRATATVAVGCATGMAVQFGGEIWTPQEQENKQLIDATEAYFRAYDIPDIPPGWMLAIVVFAYAAPRLNHETTRAKLARVKEKLLGAFKRKTQ
jgi:hypothetical protein